MANRRNRWNRVATTNKGRLDCERPRSSAIKRLKQIGSGRIAAPTGAKPSCLVRAFCAHVHVSSEGTNTLVLSY